MTNGDPIINTRTEKEFTIEKISHNTVTLKDSKNVLHYITPEGLKLNFILNTNAKKPKP